jgi:hypothetical protein
MMVYSLMCLMMMTRLLATIAMMRCTCARRCVLADIRVTWILAQRMFAMIVRVLNLVLIVAGVRIILNILMVRGKSRPVSNRKIFLKNP